MCICTIITILWLLIKHIISIVIKAGSSSTAGTVLAVPVFTSLNEETRKKTDKIHYTFNHMQKWQVLLRVLQQYSLVCQKFRWCLSNLTSDISEKSFWKDESFKARTKVVY